MSIEDRLTRRQIFNQRFAGGQSAKAEEYLERLYVEMEARILRGGTEFQLERLSALRADINNLLSRGFDDLNISIVDDILEFSSKEADFTFKAISLDTNVVLSLPAVSQIEQAVLGTAMSVNIGTETLTMREALSKFASKKIVEINQAINDGILIGDTNQQIAKEVSNLAQHRHKAQVNALVRTLTNNAASQARKAVTSQNSDILQGEEWVATLDSRTTLICAGRDGRVFPIGKGPYPPAHWNCRSLRVPKLKDEFNLDDGTEKRPEVSADGRGTTSASTTFDQFLRRQPADFQDKYFSQFKDGAEKAKLFRNGGLKIEQFRSETGVNYTLEQLEELNPIAFGKPLSSIFSQ